MRISNPAERLKMLMEERGWKQIDILNRTRPYCEKYHVRMNRSDISQYVSGKVEPSQDKLTVLSLALGVGEPWLMGYDTSENINSQNPIPDGLLPVTHRRVPLLGHVAAGKPILAEREYDEYITIDENNHRVDAALRVEGDSMIHRYLDGDIVLIRLQDDVDDGQIAAVCIDDTITLKHVYHLQDGVRLPPGFIV